jgi:hypothetical protein
LSVRSRSALLALACALALPARAAEFTSLELEPHERILGTALRDVDGAKGLELIVASAKPTGPASADRFLTFYRVSGGQASVLRQQQVPDDVVAYGIGDLTGSGTRNLVYFTAQSIFAFVAGSDTPKPVLREQRFVFAMPSLEALPFWDGIGDLDGDGRDDLVLADPTGYVVYHQDASGKLAKAGRIEAGYEFAREPVRRFQRRAREEGPLVTRRALRQLGRADVNADAKLDLIAMKDDEVFGFAQDKQGGFAATPAFKRRLIAPGSVPFAEFETAPPPAIQHGDFDRDGHVDFVVPEIDLDDLVTRLRIFMSGDGGPPEKPSQILKLSSLGDQPELTDINGDGHLDLGVACFRSDRLLSLASGGRVGSLEFSYYAFLFRPQEKQLSTRPDLRFDASWQVPQEERPASDQVDEDTGFIRMRADFDGDGVRDVALLTGDDELKIHLVRTPDGDRMRLSAEDEAFLATRVRGTSRVDFGDLDGNAHADVVLTYPDAVRVLVSP